MKLTFNRFEKKYLLNYEQYSSLKMLIKKHMDKDFYMKDDNGSNVYNLYLDNSSNDVISSCLLKPDYKEKVRLRCYKSNPDDNDEVFLEMKRKYKGRVYKRRIALSYLQAIQFIENGIKPKKDSFLDNQILKEIEWLIKKDNLSIMVYISCLRESYFLKDNKEFRITIDKSIHTRRVDLGFYDTLQDNILLNDSNYLIEIKSESNYPKWLIDFISSQSLHYTSFSKYGTEYKQHLNKEDKLCYLMEH